MSEEVQYVGDAEKVMFLGTMLLAACLTHDPDAGIYAAEDGNLIAAIHIDPAAKELAQAYFEREGAKPIEDKTAEVIAGWGYDDEAALNLYIRFDVLNPMEIPVNRRNWVEFDNRKEKAAATDEGVNDVGRNGA